MTESLPPLHLAGNCAVDLVVRTTDCNVWEPDGQSTCNLQILAEGLNAHLAGNAAWPAYLLATMGHTVQLNARIGHDLFGKFLRDQLAGAGVDLVGPDAEATAVSILPPATGGVRAGMIYPGEPIDWATSLQEVASIPSFGWFFASGYTGISPSDAEPLKRLFTGLFERQVKIVFDPGPWFADRVGIEKMFELFTMVYCLSATELELGDWFNETDPMTFAQQALDCGVEIVATKRGPVGATYASADGRTGNVPTTPVPNANTVGAGDTFNAGLIHGLSTNMPLQDAVSFAVSIATKFIRVGRETFVLST